MSTGPLPPLLPADESAPPRETAGPATFPIVGLGASAGGLEALQQLLGAVPADTGMAFVVVQHLAPDQASSLAEILAHATKMPVAEVGDEPVVEPDHVYVIPPGRDMIVAGGKLVLLPQQRHTANRGIDRFFRSLADDSAHLAIGVVLSGGLSDGTVGLEEIKAAGGVTFAQDDSAQHESMPRSAIASGCVDFVLPPEKIAEEIARIARHSYIARKADAGDGEPSSLGQIAEIVRGATGVDFNHYKASTLRRRITRRMMLHRLETEADYEVYLRGTPEEIEELYQDILISVTSFFRDSDAFDALARDVFPKILAACSSGDAVRFWVVGCASGEEAYSLAMVFAECAEAAGSAARLQIFGTDLNPRCVEKARAGWYPRSITQEVSPERLTRFFTEENGGYRVRKAIREWCVFSRHNLLSDPPFSRVNLIACRNLLIYLEAAPQQKIMPIFHYALKADGWLWLGSSESVGATSTLFEAADLRQKIFSRRAGDRPSSTRVRAAVAPGSATHEAASVRHSGHGTLHRDAERLLLAKYSPPGVVVSAGLEIVQFQGDTSLFIAPASGAASHHLLKMLREGLAGGVREALQRAQKENGPVRAEGLRVRHLGGFRVLAVEVIPIKPGKATKDGGFVVLFDESQRPAPKAERAPWLGQWWKRILGRVAAVTSHHDEEIRHLNQELAAMRESLHAMSEQHEAVVEELRSANEEAQSGNEEMQSVNEELETSKEEMEASNEELATLNDELTHRNAALSSLSNEVRAARDLAESLLASAPIPLLVLDAALRVKNANSAFYARFHLTAGQTAGRLIYDLGARQWDIPALRRMLEEVLPQEEALAGYEVRHTFEDLGPRIMLLNAARLPQAEGAEPLITLSIEDITERELEGEVRARLAAIVESSDDSITSLNLDGIVTSWNRGAQRLFGYTADEMVGQSLLFIVPEERRAEEADILAHIRRGEGIEHFETVRRRKDGTLIHITLTASPIVDAAGKIIGVSKIAQDNTARREVAEALRASEEFQRRIIASSPDCIKVLDLAGHLVSMAPGGQALLGIKDIAPYVGKSWIDFWIDDAHRAAARAAVEAAAAGGEGKFVGFFRTLHGEDKWWDVAVSPIKDAAGRPERLLAVSRDATEAKTAEDALRASQQRKEAILASALDAIITVNHEGRLMEFNPAAERIFGHARAAVLGRTLAEVMIPEHLREGHARGLKRYLATGEGRVLNKLIELPALRADGTEFPAELSIIAIPGVQPPMFTAFLRDVTARKALEESLRTRAEQLARADRSKDEFLAMLAHELRNPLAPLRNAAELLHDRGISDGDWEQAQKIFARQIENMSRMLDDLLDVSRITEGKISLRKKPVALEAVLTSAMNLVRAVCAARRQKVTLSLPSEPVFLEGDATRLEQVFGNLLTNASKYGGDDCHIALSAERAEGGVVVRVADDGAGIEPELLPRIFELFVQASRTADRAHGGLGIGLTLVKRLVHLHGGIIEAHSEGLGHGAEFIVRLPILAGPPPAPAPTARPAQETSRRVLIVDDNTDSARSLAALQKRRGHVTATAFTGPDAVTVAAEFLPEVVLLDIGLPGMDGFAVARALRANPTLRGALLIAMTGYGRDEDRAEANDAGFDEYLVKPVDLDQLRELLQRPAR